MNILNLNKQTEVHPSGKICFTTINSCSEIIVGEIKLESPYDTCQDVKTSRVPQVPCAVASAASGFPTPAPTPAPLRSETSLRSEKGWSALYDISSSLETLLVPRRTSHFC